MGDCARTVRVTSVWLVVWLGAVLAVLGAVVASVGPLLPVLARATGAGLTDAGLVISALFGGMLCAQAFSAIAMDRAGARRVLAGAVAACAGGCWGLSVAATLPMLLTAGAVMGVGYGLGSIAANLVASRLATSRPGLVINICNACYGVGAVAGPLVVSGLLRDGAEPRRVFLGAAGLLVLLLPLTALVAPTHARAAAATAARLPRKALAATALMMALAGGIEAGFSGWLATYAERTLVYSAAGAAVLTSQYWACYLGGRLLVTVASMRWPPETLLAVAVAALVGASAGLAIAGSGVSATRWVWLLGAAIGPAYPLIFGVLTRRFAGRATQAAAAVATAGSIGATVLPWVLGLTLPLAGGRGLAIATAALALGVSATVLALRVSRTAGSG
jgi:FHS family glucose/mannose:H+ symporter-like MFS transporter